MQVKVTDAYFVPEFLVIGDQLIPKDKKKRITGVGVLELPAKLLLLFYLRFEAEMNPKKDRSGMLDIEFQSPDGRLPDFAPICKDLFVPAGSGWKPFEIPIVLDGLSVPVAGTYKMVVGLERQTISVTPYEVKIVKGNQL